MPPQSPYRSLPAERRIALVTHVITAHREGRVLYAQRLVAKGGGFRAATVMSWPPDRLAKEVVRLNAQTPSDELDLLQLLYVDLEPALQVSFLDAAGVAHENGKIPDELNPPYADEDGVRRGALAVHEAHGEDGMRYLRTLLRYNLGAWPGLDAVMTELETEA